MTRALLGITGLGVILFALAGCHQPATGNTTSAKPDNDVVISMSPDGPAGQEIALDYYKTLTGWAKDYPQLRPQIIHALANDGKVTFGEFDQIEKQQHKLADAESKRKWDAKAKPYRQALSKAAQS